MANPFMCIRAVLFDMDGTLVETNIDFAAMRAETLALAKRYGVSLPDVQGLDILQIVEHTVSHLAGQSMPAEAERARQEANEVLERIEIESCERAFPIPHALELLDTLRSAGIKIGIVTRNCRSGVLLSMERTGVFSDVLLTRDDVPRTKPDPDHLLRALRMLEVYPVESTTIGDHWMDIQAGHAAGTRTIGFLRADRADDFFDRVKPDLIIRDLGELISSFERLKD